MKIPGKTDRTSLFGGRLSCRQPTRGYRFSQDSVFLAHFPRPYPNEQILDLGAGCGIISLIIAYRHPELSVVAFELQEHLAETARSNVACNRLASRIEVVEGDLRRIGEYFQEASFNRVVCNPPYRKSGAARLNPDDEKALARHEVMADLDDIVRAFDRMLGRGGKVDLVYPHDRLGELKDKLGSGGFYLNRLRKVYGYPGTSCRVVLVEAVKGMEGDCRMIEPLYVKTAPDGNHAPEAAAYYEP